MRVAHAPMTSSFAEPYYSAGDTRFLQVTLAFAQASAQEHPDTKSADINEWIHGNSTTPQSQSFAGKVCGVLDFPGGGIMQPNKAPEWRTPELCVCV